MIAQLEFPEISKHFPPGQAITPPPRRRLLPHISAQSHPDPVILSNALTAENIGFFTFALILALHRHATGTPMTLANLARTVGHSYFAVRSQIVNTQYFACAGKSPMVTVKLTPDASTKLARIEKRLNA